MKYQKYHIEDVYQIMNIRISHRGCVLNNPGDILVGMDLFE